MIDREKDTNYVPIEKRTPETITKQINYIIIEKLWTEVTQKYKDEFYKKIGINKNSYSSIRLGQTAYYGENAKKARTRLNKLGLPEGIMSGQEMIELEGLTRDWWIEYLRCWENEPTEDDIEGKKKKANELRRRNRRIKEAFKKIDPGRKKLTPLEVFYFFFKEGEVKKIEVKDIEMKALYDSLKEITPSKVKTCDKELRSQIYELLKTRYEWLEIVTRYNDF